MGFVRVSTHVSRKPHSAVHISQTAELPLPERRRGWEVWFIDQKLPFLTPTSPHLASSRMGNVCCQLFPHFAKSQTPYTFTYAKWEEREMPCKFSMSPIAMLTSLPASLLINLRHEAQQKAAKKEGRNSKRRALKIALIRQKQLIWSTTPPSRWLPVSVATAASASAANRRPHIDTGTRTRTRNSYRNRNRNRGFCVCQSCGELRGAAT